ncbi:MAG: hypothetical protein E6R08_00955 [Nevskiaceae bacterium]|nr:MAG: hypothetical protein E6R08_00955 [Nevskiaceae bacterium]
MVNPSVLSTLAGVTGLIAALCLLAYLFVQQRPERHPHDLQDLPGGLAEAVAGLSGKNKAEVLREHIKSVSPILLTIYRKAKPLDLNRQAAGDRAFASRRLLVTVGLFAFLATVGLIYAITTPRAPAPQAQDQVAQAPVTKVAPSPVSAAAPAPTPKFAWRSVKPGGSPYTVQVKVTSHNRHNESKVGYGQTEFLSQFPELRGLETRIVGVDYHCSGVDGRCAWSQDGNGGHGKNVAIAPDKQSFYWFRSWDGDPVDEVYTVFLEAYVCVEGCAHS